LTVVGRRTTGVLPVIVGSGRNALVYHALAVGPEQCTEVVQPLVYAIGAGSGTPRVRRP